MTSTLNSTRRTEGRWNPRYVWPAVMWLAVVLVLLLCGAGAFVMDIPQDVDLRIADALWRTQGIEPDIAGNFGWPGLFALRSPMSPIRPQVTHMPEAPWPVNDVPGPLPSTPS